MEELYAQDFLKTKSLKKKKTTETDSLLVEKTETDPLIPDIEFIKKEFRYLRNAIEKQNTNISTIIAMLREFVKEVAVPDKNENKFTFPIETVSDFEELERETKLNPEKYVEVFRDMIFGRGGLEKNLKCIISAEVALHYNWDGTSGKKAFKDYKHINVALYTAIKPEITAPDVYKKAIRQGLKRIKNLHFKRISLKKQKQDLKHIIEETFTY